MWPSFGEGRDLPAPAGNKTRRSDLLACPERVSAELLLVDTSSVDTSELQLLVAVCGAALALVFGTAAWAKIDGWTSWSVSSALYFRRFGRLGRVVVPAVEVGTAVMLLVVPQQGLWAAGAVLSVFACGVVMLIPAHRGADCNCFGNVGSSTIGYRLAMRNLALAALALLAAWSHAMPPGVSPVIATADHAVLVGLTVMLTWLTIEALRLRVAAEHRRRARSRV